jgi:hypothetical protein
VKPQPTPPIDRPIQSGDDRAMITPSQQAATARVIFAAFCALTVGWLMWELQPAPAPLAPPVPGTVTGNSPT